MVPQAERRDMARARPSARQALLLLGVGLVVGAMTGLAGTAAAAPGDGTMEVPEPTPGDRGSYWISHVTVDSEGNPTDSSPPRLLNVFEWLSPEPLMTRDGRWHVADRVLEQQDAGPHPSQSSVQIRSLDPQTGEIFAETRERLAFWDDQPADWWMERWDFKNHDSEGLTSWQPFCGLTNYFQGQTVPLSEPAELVPHCRLMTQTWEVPTFGSGTFDHQATFESGHGPVHIFAASYRGAPVQAWFAEEIPYPVRLVHPLVQGPGADVSPDTFQVIDLRGFEPGNGSAVRSSIDDRSSFGPPEKGARTAWMLEDEGIEHPFPLSEAYRVALDDEGGDLAAYLDTHPNAYAHNIDARAWVEDDEMTHRWALELTDGVETLSLVVVQEIRQSPEDEEDNATVPLLAAMTGEDQDGNGQARVTYELGVQGPEPAPESHPAPESLPDRLPTVGSMLEAWSTIVGEQPEMEHVVWKLDVSAGQSLVNCVPSKASPCSGTPGVEIKVGETHRYDESETRLVTFNANGQPVGMTAQQELASPSAYPTWYAFSNRVEEIASNGDPPEPVLTSYEHLPSPPGESDVFPTIVGAIGSVGAAGLIVRWRRSDDPDS